MRSTAPVTARLMRRIALIASLGLALTGPASADPEPFADASSWIPGHFQVEVWGGGDIRPIAAEHGLQIVDSFDACHLLASNGELDDSICLEELRSDLRLTWAELAYRQHTPESTRQMVVAVVGGTVDEYASQNVYEHLALEAIHEHTRGAGAVVAIIDTGIDPQHPALLGKILSGGYDFVADDDKPWETANQRDDDEDGLVDEAAGHGTMVAGIVALVAPDAHLLPIRALDDDGNGTAFGVARAIHFATEQGVDIINLSLGLPEFSMAIDRAIAGAEEAGIVVVAAAGNESTDDPPYFPASSPFTVSVASTGPADIKSDFSNYHKSVDVSAPGELILAPYIDGGWAVGSGTSFAAPFISGQAALVLSAAPFIDKRGAERKIEEGTIQIDGLIGNQPYRGMLGTGRFDGSRTWDLLFESTTSELVASDSDLFGAGVRWAPNPIPSGSSTQLELRAVPEGASSIEAVIHDAAGRRIRSLGSTDLRRLEWDGRDDSGRLAPSGTYFVSVSFRGASSAEATSPTSRILVLR